MYICECECLFVWLNVLVLLGCLFTVGRTQESRWTVWVGAGVSGLGLVTTILIEWLVVKVGEQVM